MFERCCVEKWFVDGSLGGCCSSHDRLVLLRGHLRDNRNQGSIHLCLVKLHPVMTSSNNLARLVCLWVDPIDTQTWVL
jgi:hypothetical protein